MRSSQEYDDGYSLGFDEAADQREVTRYMVTPDSEDWTRGYLDGREGWRQAVEGVNRV